MNNRKRDLPSSAHRFSYDGLDRLIHERARLGVLTSLFTKANGLSFTDLKGLCGLTDGNLSRHVQVLEEAKLLQVTKSHATGRPQSLYRLTALGRRRFLKYIGVLEQVIQDAGLSSVPDQKDDLAPSR
jgi:YD repeat-containing protein